MPLRANTAGTTGAGRAGSIGARIPWPDARPLALHPRHPAPRCRHGGAGDRCAVRRGRTGPPRGRRGFRAGREGTVRPRDHRRQGRTPSDPGVGRRRWSDRAGRTRKRHTGCGGPAVRGGRSRPGPRRGAEHRPGPADRRRSRDRRGARGCSDRRVFLHRLQVSRPRSLESSSERDRGRRYGCRRGSGY